MNKITKGLLAGAVVVSLFATMGCGGGDKKKEDPKPATTTTQKQDKAPEVKQAKVKPVPKSSMYRYALHLDDVNKLPPMTDEVIKEFEKQAKPIKIAEKDPKKHRAGIWTFNSAPQRKGAQVYTYRWEKLRSVRVVKYHVTKETGEKGKLEELYKQTFK